MSPQVGLRGPGAGAEEGDEALLEGQGMVSLDLGIADFANAARFERDEGTAADIGGGQGGDDADAEAVGDEGEDGRQMIAFKDLLKLDFGAAADSENIVAETVSFTEEQHAFAE